MDDATRGLQSFNDLQILNQLRVIDQLTSRVNMVLNYPGLRPITPVLRKSWKRKRLVIVAPSSEWGTLLPHDADPEFDLMTYSYDGSEQTAAGGALPGVVGHIALKTEMWGESLKLLFAKIPAEYEVVFFLNSDIYMSYSSINRLFDYADLFALDICQPALSLNSFYSHQFLLKKTAIDVEAVPFVEIMMPCLSRAVIDEMNRLGIFSISGWGLDKYVFANIVERLKLRPQCVVHAVTAIHTKPVESSRMRFSNGKTAHEECEELRQLCERI
jgi:hypothetical protein